ncbi:MULTISPECIES: N-acetyl-D-Glu racemase DgcA [unclassified Sphingobium]|uniref:N-acetyl-D-Glu racemase DgcA n=1 Tax=Sphingobium TaxID=165695 RepID=UPI0015EBF7D6|nr:L-alanine-DL-glutamate epimerase-like enolase superfamily enzyme [Sphingobium sp. B10D3B]MCW2401628.1 L-alanine-DL-glutamate epimerase-like enolase superfamily enzyme [Sphingobium sp. B10D7B]MCW2408608.1 L-alanine-DL-glutamate epimerase-like enolase superfamily enzyme [Sphingobium xanthum]
MIDIGLQQVAVERFAVRDAFTISRGAKTFVDVVVCVVTDGMFIGRGEGTPIYYHGETAEGCAAAIEALVQAQGGVPDREALRTLMPPGAARNALDCALWDLEAARTGKPVWALAGLEAPQPVRTAYTISLDTPGKMARGAADARARGFTLLKCKLTGEGDRARIEAVRQGAPDVDLIVDANESWADLDVQAQARALADLGVALIEQPLPAQADAALAGLALPVPICADESCQSLADLARLGAYQAINIKLDKAGGLTEALAMAHAARAAGKRIMVGCMLASSLGIAPAFLLAQFADWVDLDGALLLAHDREGAMKVANGYLSPGTLWGEAIITDAQRS